MRNLKTWRSHVRWCRWLIVAGLGACGGEGGLVVPPDTSPASISITPAGSHTIVSGETLTLRATALTKDGKQSSATISWTTSDPSVASVSEGIVHAGKVGTAIVAAATGGLSATVAIIVAAGSPKQLGIRTQPVGSSLDAPLATQPVIEVWDGAGNLVATDGLPITASLSSGSGTLTGPLTATSTSGVAAFSRLGVAGGAGTKRLAFSSPGLAPVTSAEFVMSPAQGAVLVVDSAALRLTAPAGGDVVTATLRADNAGSSPLGTLSLDTVAYDSGQPRGWLAASLSGTTTPATLTFRVAPGTIAPGTYHATVRVIASNTPAAPVSISVTATIVSYSINYGSATEKLQTLEVGASSTPTVAFTAAGGGPLTGVRPEFASRASSVATVDATGRITAVGPGAGWIVARTSIAGDSVWVTVPLTGNDPVIRSNRSTWVGRVGETLSITFTLDTRGVPVGAALIALGFDRARFTFSFTAPAGPPTPVITLNAISAQNDPVYRIVVASVPSLPASTTLITLKLTIRSLPSFTDTGYDYIRAFPLNVTAADGTDITARVTSLVIPLVYR